MSLSEKERAFLETNHGAAMITIAKDGLPKVARVGVALVDGKLWSSGTQDRVRTPRLRRDKRCVLYVFEAGWRWLALETKVRILEGAQVSGLSVRLFRVMQNRPTGPLSWFGGEMSEEAFAARMVEEKRVIYEFEIERSYGAV